MTSSDLSKPPCLRLSPAHPSGAQSPLPAASLMRRGCPQAGGVPMPGSSPCSYPSLQYPIAKGCRSSLTAWAPTQPELTCRSRTPPSQLTHLPARLPSLASLSIRHRRRQHHGESRSLQDVRSTSPTALLVSFVTAEIQSNMRRELHVRLALFSPAVAISGLSCSQTG